jgi:putative OPT family oligopeptide transporter
MIITAFFFVAVSSYIVGLVGSSNNPVSGMVIVTVIFASILLLLFRMTGTQGLIAALLIAGVVCCAACTAADVSQDLKTGHLLGATPKKQQYGQIIGVAVAALIIAPILVLLHQAYGIGTGEPGSLNAPQASLFASLVGSMFTGKALPWTLVAIGACIGVALILIDEILRRQGSRFRMHVMPVAVGIYLPLSLSVPIVIGGALSLAVKALALRTGNNENAMPQGVLFSSGLIAGEAITGIGVALLIVIGLKLPWILCESDLLSLFIYALVIAGFIYFTARRKRCRQGIMR